MGAVYTPNVLAGAGEELELIVRQGATLGPLPHAIVLDDGEDTPFDLTGYTFSSVITSYIDPSFTQTFDFDLSRVADGVYTFGLSDEKTATLRAGANVWSPASLHYWQTDMQSPDGRIIPLYFGELRVHPRMTPVAP